MSRLLFLNHLRWYGRWPAKWAALALTLLAVCYPYPGVLVRQLSRIGDPDRLVDPHAPSLQPLLDELRPQLADDPAPREALKRVERFVYRKVPYDWDWNVWGVSDYWPTVEEVLAMGREDCDGQAVVAASLLRGLGFDAHLAGSLVHMWVETAHGDAMSPTGRKSMVATDDGLRFNWEALADIPKSAAFGIAVFPLTREVIVVVVFWWLLLGCGSQRRSAAGLTLLLGGLLLLRWLCTDFTTMNGWIPVPGAALITAGVVVMFRRARGKEAGEEFVKVNRPA